MTSPADTQGAMPVKPGMRVRLEMLFERVSHGIFDHCGKVILVFILLLAGLTSQLPPIIDTSTEGFLKEDDPFRKLYNDFRFQFGRDERAIILVDSGSTIFTQSFLKQLEQLHRALENEVPKLQQVQSLINARLTYGENDQLIVKDFLEEWPQNQAQLDALAQRALSNNLYLDQYLSRDGRYALLLIETDAYSSIGVEQSDELDELLGGFDEQQTAAYTADNHPAFLTGEENTEIVLKIEEITDRYQKNGFAISFAGTPFMVDILTRILMSDMQKFMGIAMLIIAALLWLVYRRVAMIFLPLTIAMVAMLFTMSIMAITGIPMTSAGQIMPSFLITVGVANAVHLFGIFFQRSKLRESKRDALAHAMSHTGMAILMTSLTTIVGLMSFYSSSVKPVADFGLITALGIFNALICSLVLLPALIAFLPIQEHAEVEDHSKVTSQRILRWCGDIAISHPWKVVCIFLTFVAFCFSIAIQMRFSHNPLAWFEEDNIFRTTSELINRDLGGSMFVEVMIDTGEKDGLKNPNLLNRMDQLQSYLLNNRHGVIDISKIVSIVDIVKETHQALHNNDPTYYRIPDDKALLSQEILLFENSGSDDLQRLVDGSFSLTHMTIKLPMSDAVDYPALDVSLNGQIEKLLEPVADIKVTGLMAIMGKTFNELLVSLVRSYTLSFVLITLMMMLFVESFRLGLLSMIPNLSPIIITLALMVVVDFPLDAFTLLIGAIGLGLAVDDTLHFMNAYQRGLRQSGDPKQAVYHALSTAGEAMLFTSIILSIAFFIYALATMQNLQNFGILTGFCILVAFLADAFLNPAIMYLYGRSHK